jgi:hypothetical protein
MTSATSGAQVIDPDNLVPDITYLTEARQTPEQKAHEDVALEHLLQAMHLLPTGQV